ncbi:MAG TPA: dicarboxylate/amino acid:cation symporter [Gammaproteobacteria bacterium]
MANNNGFSLPSLSQLQPPQLKDLSSNLQKLVRGRLWLQVLIGMVLGIAFGISIGPSTEWVAPATAILIGNWLALPGHVFLSLIQMIVIPLVFASIILGLASTENVQQLKSVGTKSVIYFIITTTVAICIGISLAILIQPGSYIDSAMIRDVIATTQVHVEANHTPSMQEIPQKLITLLPTNPLSSMVNSNLLHVVIFAIIFGIALVMMPYEQAKPLLDLLGSLQEVCMTIVRWAMLLAPFAVFGLLAQLTAKIGLEVIAGMSVYIAVVILGLLILFILYMLLLKIFTDTSASNFIRNSRDVLLLAFSTSSSAAVMPLSIKTAQEKLGISKPVSQFVIPLGATINMNGTALYQGVAALFLAQIFNVDISTSGMLLLVVTAVASSIGAPATPGVGIVILAMLLTTVGIPAAGIALILGVDRILDMCRTAINVAGDLVAAKLIDQWNKNSAEVTEQKS